MFWVLSAAVLLLLLAVPVELMFWVERHAAWRGSVRLHWLLGLVRVKLRPPRAKPVPSASERRKGGRRTKARALATDPDAWHHAAKLMARLWRAVRPRDFRLDARIGFDNPADTGILWGSVGPALAVLVPANAGIHVSPSFDEALLEVESSGRIRLIPLQLLAILLVFALSPSTWRLMWKAHSR